MSCQNWELWLTLIALIDSLRTGWPLHQFLVNSKTQQPEIPKQIIPIILQTLCYSTMSNDQTLTLSDRVAIVAGGSRGIGRAISLHLRSLGAKIVINYSSNSNQADLLASELNSSSNSSSPVAISVRADISNPDQVKSLFDQAELHFSTKGKLCWHSRFQISNYSKYNIRRLGQHF